MSGSGDGRIGLRAEHEEAGAVFGASDPEEAPRHYGDPSGEYRAAVEEVAVTDRSFRGRFRITGRDPERMMNGVLSGRIPPPPGKRGGEVVRGEGSYSAVLTPKGKMISDLRIFRLGGEEGFLLDLPAAGVEGVREHFGKFIPPLFAKVEDVTEEMGMITVLGPRAAELVTREALGLRLGVDDLEALGEDDWALVGKDSREGVRVIRFGGVATPAWDLLADGETLRALWGRLRKEGAVPAGRGVWETLRIEGGRPAFGADMDEDTIPVEAGIHRRAIDETKGCYTGQEVIVRIRDRGRVNWHLRGLLLGDAPTPSAGTELFDPGEEKAVGRVTSAADSPRLGQAAGLGYVRREVEPPATLRLGEIEGPEVRIRGLTDEGWDWVEGDPGPPG